MNQKKNPMRSVLARGDFRLLFAGTGLSLLGDQFALIATPWLVLQLTGDAAMLGLVLALEGLPRAAFMLIGGALTDRISPRGMMLIADTLRLGLTALMAAAVLTGAIAPWMLIAFALGFGLVAGFAVPAQNAIVPTLVAEGELAAGNGIVMGATELAAFVGPSVAGIVIGAWAGSLTGVGLAYAIDAGSFAASALCLLMIRGGRREAGGEAPEPVFAAIRSAWAYLWGDPVLRLMFGLIAGINFLLIGPLLVGIPLLAHSRLPEGARAFGLLMSAFAGGNLLGFIAAGALPKPGARLVKAVLVALLFGFGLVVGALALVPSTATDFGLLFVLGTANGYVSILLFTWIQSQTPRAMLGRVMSMLMLANTGLVPLSQALSGMVGKWNLDTLFLTACGLSLALTLWAITRPELTLFSHSLAGSRAPAEA